MSRRSRQRHKRHPRRTRRDGPERTKALSVWAAIAVWATEALVRAAPDSLPRAAEISVSVRTLLFATGSSADSKSHLFAID